MQSLQFFESFPFKSASPTSSSTDGGSPPSSPVCKEKSRRLRKNSKQVDFLTSQFFENPNWDKSQLKILSRQTGLSVQQVYKWGWDFRKKFAQDSLALECKETLFPSVCDFSMVRIQKEFRESTII